MDIALGPHFKEVLIPEIRVSRDFAEAFVYVTNAKGSILHYYHRQCTHEIRGHVRVKEGTVIDYEWLRAFAQVKKRRAITNAKIVAYVVREMVFTVGDLMTCAIPPDDYDILIHADGSWERCLLALPEDDVVCPYIKSLPIDVQKGFEHEAKEYWDRHHCSIHEQVKVYNSEPWKVEP